MDRQQWVFVKENAVGFAFTFENLVVMLATSHCVFWNEKKKEKRKENVIRNIQISSWLFWATHSSPCLPHAGKALAQSGLNVAWVGDSQTHEGSYIYWINDTLCPPHNSCLLHLADWDWRSTLICRALWLLYVCFALLKVEINVDTPMQKQPLDKAVFETSSQSGWRPVWAGGRGREVTCRVKSS